MSRRSEFEDAIVAEVAQWPGVTMTLDQGGKHPVAILGFDGLTVRRPYAGTTSDSRFGKHRMLGDLRRALRDLGAKRSKPESVDDDGPDVKLDYRPPNEGKAKRPHPVAADPAVPPPTVAEQVAAVAATVAPDTNFPLPDREAGDGTREKVFELSPKVARHLERTRPDLAPLRVKADPQVARDGWGLYTDIPAVDYHLDPCPEPSISNSLMDAMLTKTPRDFAWSHPRRHELFEGFPEDEELEESTQAQVMGDVVHQLALGKGRGFEILPYKDFRTTEAKNARDDAMAAGLTPILKAKHEEALPLAERIQESIRRTLDGADYETEVVAMYQEQTHFGPVWVRIMMDVWCPERAIILDPKVTSRLYDGVIERHALAMGWDRQAALYPHAVEQIMPELAGRVEFTDLLINPDPPYVSRLWAPEKAWEASSVRQCQLAIDRFAECLFNREWPGFAPGRTRGPMPAWEDKRRTEQELGA